MDRRPPHRSHRRQKIYPLLALLLLVPHLLASQQAKADLPSLIDFDLKDQFERSYSRATFANQSLVVFARDRTGSTFKPAWAAALSEALALRGRQKEFFFVDVADLRSAPSFMRKMVLSKFPTDRSRWTLMGLGRGFC